MVTLPSFSPKIHKNTFNSPYDTADDPRKSDGNYSSCNLDHFSRLLDSLTLDDVCRFVGDLKIFTMKMKFIDGNLWDIFAHENVTFLEYFFSVCTFSSLFISKGSLRFSSAKVEAGKKWKIHPFIEWHLKRKKGKDSRPFSGWFIAFYLFLPTLFRSTDDGDGKWRISIFKSIFTQIFHFYKFFIHKTHKSSRLSRLTKINRQNYTAKWKVFFSYIFLRHFKLSAEEFDVKDATSDSRP